MNHVFRNGTRLTGTNAQPPTRTAGPRLVIEHLDAAPEQGYVPSCDLSLVSLLPVGAFDAHGQLAA
ncbi:hypothetical protein FHS39_002150 [Streptomyces olivoverticillatus]|uniref:Uncharacterized protein n=1 Tax=Streptomyces olivoverticillatus TaxID=66427 RepID=A0A7W7PKE1_9ACTN|nr:hypothetical protein [Streptomyces olivoverticillatus]MBB4893119.1 hypothetical protein [Streptomyces olivoverticillatus]